MTGQLSTVQQLWRDRREEFEAYLDGRSEAFSRDGNRLSAITRFGEPPDYYQFRPLPNPPKPPKLRPWNASELWEHRDCWFCEIGYEETPGRITEFNLKGLVAHLQNDDYTTDLLLQRFHWLDANGNWQPCGIEVTE